MDTIKDTRLYKLIKAMRNLSRDVCKSAEDVGNTDSYYCELGAVNAYNTVLTLMEDADFAERIAAIYGIWQ